MAIFKDREKLTPRYIPSSLSHRERELELLLLQAGTLAENQVSERQPQIIGQLV